MTTKIKLPAPFRGGVTLQPGMYLLRPAGSKSEWQARTVYHHDERSNESYEYLGPIKLDIEEPMPEPDFDGTTDAVCNPLAEDYWYVYGHFPEGRFVRADHPDKRTAIEMFNAAVKVLREAAK